jgi:predicted transcriptional regulator
MDKKKIILQYLLKNPGVKSVDINVNMNRSSVGAYLRSLLDAKMITQDEDKGWHVASWVDVVYEPPEETGMDIAEKAIRSMMFNR